MAPFLITGNSDLSQIIHLIINPSSTAMYASVFMFRPPHIVQTQQVTLHLDKVKASNLSNRKTKRRIEVKLR